MADKRISQLAERVDIANNDVVAIVAGGATVTNKATMSSIQAFMQGALDVGVTSVGVTISETDGQPISVTGSPITQSGNITINLPRATNSIRGVLDSEDFINFSNKQGTITLTTSGTSGDATFDGSLLNIPNYTTDTSGFVTLDTDQTITGIKTFGNNALQVASGGSGSFPTVIRNITVNSLISGGLNHLGFNNLNNIYFSKGSGSFNAGVFAFNNTGTRTYTLQDASGTLALTSDLTGFVTLDTNQTITAQKTITTSGGDDTLIVNHTSGSGIALDIAKAGNGEGLRVAKSSGSGNAVTITGGMLSAESSVFGGNVTINAGDGDQLVLNNAGERFTQINFNNNTVSKAYIWYDNTNNELGFLAASSGTDHLRIASTGEATFSSSVTSNDSNSFLLNQTGNATDTKIWAIQNNPSSGQFRIRALNDSMTTGINAIVISRTGISSVSLDFTGAATFSSLGTGTVSATSGTLSTSSDSSYKVDDGFIDSALEKVLKLKPRYFYWNELSGLPTDIRQLGFYAQEVNEALGEEAANTPQDENTSWGIMDRSVIAMLTKAIQEQQEQIDSLKNQIK